MNTTLYPKSPELSDYDFIKPTSEFKRVATSVVASIILFFIFYVILIAVATGVMISAGWAGITIIAIRPNFLTITAGAGIIGLGIMFFLFLFKFIFSNRKDENPHRLELKKDDHPELFRFIQSLNQDTKTQFPKKIFISPDVNAMVFYNSSFWSLFFPVRKNLEIGLGLVNTLNLSEFKAVLAHEFGHFSQRSMKIGSYIYTVNRVIYNLVYEYDNWDNWLSNWAQAGGVFGFFAGITLWMVERVRSLMKLAYNIINIYYMKLSREMEYHADLVAVSVSGNAPIKNALRKLEFSSFAYEYTMGYLNALASKQKSSSNIYSDHKYTLLYLAHHNKVRVDDGDLHITDQDMENNVIKSRVNIKDQWASHPSLPEREANISKVEITCDENTISAWGLFTDPDQLQKKMTENLYKIGFPDSKLEKLQDLEYQEFVQTELHKYKISEDYHGFYDERYLTSLELKELINSQSTTNFKQLYTKENSEKIKRYNANKLDLEILTQINTKQIDTKYFEFDDKKFKRKEARKLIGILKDEIDHQEVEIEALDKASFIVNYQNSVKSNSEQQLVSFYEQYFHSIKDIKSMDEINNRVHDFANRLYGQAEWTEEGIKRMASELSQIELQFKDFMKRQNLQVIIQELESDDQKATLKEYMNSNNFYIKTTEFDEQSFINLNSLMQDVYNALTIHYGHTLKTLTDFQIEIR